MPRYLIVAHQTLGGDQLVARIERLRTTRRLSVRLVVPALDVAGPGVAGPDAAGPDAAGPDAAGPGAAGRVPAETRLQQELDRLHSLGVEAVGEVVDGDPVGYVRDLMRREHFDEVIISVGSSGRLRRWLHTDLSHRLARAVAVPVEDLTTSSR